MVRTIALEVELREWDSGDKTLRLNKYEDGEKYDLMVRRSVEEKEEELEKVIEHVKNQINSFLE